MKSDIIEQNNKTLHTLTHPQKRVWYVEKIYPDTSLYNIGGTIKIKGSINFDILEKSINLFIKRNEGLRLRFTEQFGEVRQYTSSYERIKLDFLNFSKYDEPEAEFKKWIEEEARKPFQIQNERLFYFALFKVSDNENGYFTKFHHIISDGWSVNIMTEQICNTYMQLLSGEYINKTQEQSYFEYIDSEKKYLLSNRFLRNKDFWNKKFEFLPETFLHNSSDFIEGKRKTYRLCNELSSKIRKITIDNNCSLNTFFVSLLLLYLNKTTLQEDIVIGTPVLNRSGKKEKSIFGMFTSTMPFRFKIDDNANVLEMISKVNKELMECYYNQKYPYNLLVRDLGLKKRGYDNLFNICVNYYNTRLNTELNGLPIENIEFYNGNQIYSLQLVIKDWTDSEYLTLDFDYKVNDFSDGKIENIYIRIINLVNQIIEKPFKKVRELSLFFKDERQRLISSFNETTVEYPKDKTIYRIFEEQVQKTPDKIAVCFNNVQLTYRELNEKANQLARYLVKKGTARETILGLFTTHSIETVIGIFGILKAGGAYLPIDISLPDERINYMLHDSSLKILLTNTELPENIHFNGDVVNLNDVRVYEQEASNLETYNIPEDLVYLIYTSGSTGNPKGTMIEHQGLVNYIWWAKKTYVKGNEVFPLYSSLSFDLTVTSIFTPLISGSKIIVYWNSDDEDEYVLYRIMKENKATIIKLTPSHLSLIQDRDNTKSSVKRFIVGGEDLKISLARSTFESFGRNVEIFNEYGPTEAVVGCMIHKYDYERDNGKSVPIGIPADNVQIYILDKNLNPVLTNTIGEVYISGDGIARGYLNIPELTKERFITNPFSVDKRMYKTGDIARFTDDGEIEYVGRADQQVKIRGYRIELNEIEKYLLCHAALKDAVVIDIEGKNNFKYLCAYIVKKEQILVNELKDFLLMYLPDYMVPLHFIELDEIPLSENGKVNRTLLPFPCLENNNNDFITFKNDKEKLLLNTISKVMSLGKLRIKDNFYNIGGDSISAIQISSKIRDNGYNLKVKDILSFPILEEMAMRMEQSEISAIAQGKCHGSIMTTPIVAWFLSKNFANVNYYNQRVLLELKQDIDVKILQKAFDQLIQFHDSLRLNYSKESGELNYNSAHLENQYIIPEYDLTNINILHQDNQLINIINNINNSMDIYNGILIKAAKIKVEKNKQFVLFIAHHLVVDGVSWRIILEDLYTLLMNSINGLQLKLPCKTNSYQEWAENLHRYGKKIEQPITQYWENVMESVTPIKKGQKMADYTVRNNNTLKAGLDELQTQFLLTEANHSYNTEVKDLLLTSLVKTFNEITGKKELIVELEGHGRDNIMEGLETFRTVGWFTSIYLAKLKMVTNELSDLIKSIKEQLREIPNNGIDFGILNYMSKSLENEYISDIRFNFLGTFDMNNELFSYVQSCLNVESHFDNAITSFLEVNCMIQNGKFELYLTYNRHKYTDKNIEKLINLYVDNLDSILKHCHGKKDVDYTPSDFDTVDINQDELDSLFL